MASPLSIDSNYAGTSSTAQNDRLASDKQTFLKLLVAQLQYQDPLNPSEDTEFVSQLAQFTSLEQLQEINAGVENLNSTVNETQMTSAVNFLGKDVAVLGNQITKLSDSDGNNVTTRIYYTVEREYTKGQVDIYTSSGAHVYQGTIPAKGAGTHDFAWTGMNSWTGKAAGDGLYTAIISCRDADDNAVTVTQQFAARVMSVLNEDGVYKLGLDGGRTANLTDVTQVLDADDTVTEVTTNAGLAANYAAAASLAADDAAGYEAVALKPETTANDAKKAALSAAGSATTAAEAATKALEAATAARKEAETLKTDASLQQYNAAKASADAAQAYADAALQSANTAKTAAEGKGAVFD